MLSAGLGFAAVLILIFLSVPIAIALGVTGFVGYAMLNAVAPALSPITLKAGATGSRLRRRPCHPVL